MDVLHRAEKLDRIQGTTLFGVVELELEDADGARLIADYQVGVVHQLTNVKRCHSSFEVLLLLGLRFDWFLEFAELLLFNFLLLGRNQCVQNLVGFYLSARVV